MQKQETQAPQERRFLKRTFSNLLTAGLFLVSNVPLAQSQEKTNATASQTVEVSSEMTEEERKTGLQIIMKDNPALIELYSNLKKYQSNPNAPMAKAEIWNTEYEIGKVLYNMEMYIEADVYYYAAQKHSGNVLRSYENTEKYFTKNEQVDVKDFTYVLPGIKKAIAKLGYTLPEETRQRFNDRLKSVKVVSYDAHENAQVAGFYSGKGTVSVNRKSPNSMTHELIHLISDRDKWRNTILTEGTTTLIDRLSGKRKMDPQQMEYFNNTFITFVIIRTVSPKTYFDSYFSDDSKVLKSKLIESFGEKLGSGLLYRDKVGLLIRELMISLGDKKFESLVSDFSRLLGLKLEPDHFFLYRPDAIRKHYESLGESASLVRNEVAALNRIVSLDWIFYNSSFETFLSGVFETLLSEKAARIGARYGDEQANHAGNIMALFTIMGEKARFGDNDYGVIPIFQYEKVGGVRYELVEKEKPVISTSKTNGLPVIDTGKYVIDVYANNDNKLIESYSVTFTTDSLDYERLI